MNDGKTCAPDWKAMYHRASEELEKSKYENEELRKKIEYLRKDLECLRAVQQTVEVIFGRRFNG